MSTVELLNFIQYYNGLPTKADQKELRYAIIKACKKSKSLFYEWIYERRSVDEKSQIIISEIIGIPKEILFPETINIDNQAAINSSNNQ